MVDHCRASLADSGRFADDLRTVCGLGTSQQWPSALRSEAAPAPSPRKSLRLHRPPEGRCVSLRDGPPAHPSPGSVQPEVERVMGEAGRVGRNAPVQSADPYRPQPGRDKRRTSAATTSIATGLPAAHEPRVTTRAGLFAAAADDRGRALSTPRRGLAGPAHDRPAPAGWSPRSNAVATPWSSTRAPDRGAERREDTLRPPRAAADGSYPPGQGVVDRPDRPTSWAPIRARGLRSPRGTAGGSAG